ncbi:MAG: hypothetical protein QM784_08280 [Polyangiaceae bacterium]
MKNLGRLGFVVTILLASACSKSETVESEDIRTSGIYPEITVLAEGNGKSTATVKLKVGGDDSNTTLELTGKDELTCTAGDESKKLTQSGDSYKTTFATDEAGTEFVFSFDRGDEDENAPNSHVILPDPFSIEGVESSTEVSRADDELTVTWDASDANDTHSWTLKGDCLFDTDGDVSKDGTVTLKGDDFNATPSAEKEDATDEEKQCKATLCIERKRVGGLDPAFKSEEGGEIRAIQKRCVSFVSVP